jgi:dipeptidyl aminopeptidase/acylaminoacyl peptidase
MVERVASGGTLNGWQLNSVGNAVIASRSRAAEPYEMFRIPLNGGPSAQLTRFNRGLVDEVDLRPAERLKIAVEGGREVLVYLVKPHGFDPGLKYPLILNVHGGPQGHWSDAYRGDWQIYPGKGYVVALPNPTGSIGFGQDFVDAVSCDWGGRPYRELMQVTDALAGLPFVDRDRLAAMGWSYGGYMVMWFAGHTARFKALAAMMGDYDLRSMHGTTDEPWFMEHELCGTPWTSTAYDRWSPSRFAGSFVTPTMVVTGQRDFRVAYTQSLHFFSDLQRMGVPSRMAVFENSGHAPRWQDMILYFHLHLDWFHRWLGGGRAATTLEDLVGHRPAVARD